jgi:hypothetical protein
MDDNFHVLKYGGGAQETTLEPLTVALLVLVVCIIVFTSRKRIILPVLAASLLIPLGQALVMGPLHFMVIRLIILAVWVKLLWVGTATKRSHIGIRLTGLDKAVCLWALSATLFFIVQYGNSGAVINRLGFLYNTFGIYFLLRALTESTEDIDRIMRAAAYLCASIAGLMILEHITGKNVLSVFGGVPAFTVVRDGRLRSQGPFGHAILAGTFGAILVPLFVGLWYQGRRNKSTAMLGIVSCTVITLASASSTPLMAYAAGVAALLFYPLRKHMRPLRWGFLVLLVGLHLVMKAPVWALIGRMDVIGSSAGYHRYALVDQTLRHFRDWWFCGVRDSADWGWDMGDTVNQYVDCAVTGGLATLVSFIAIVAKAFQRIGVARRACSGYAKAERRVWALGACMFANMTAFFGINYFDQTQVAWFAILAMISALPVVAGARQAETQALPSGNAGVELPSVFATE